MFCPNMFCQAPKKINAESVNLISLFPRLNFRVLFELAQLELYMSYFSQLSLVDVFRILSPSLNQLSCLKSIPNPLLEV